MNNERILSYIESTARAAALTALLLALAAAASSLGAEPPKITFDRYEPGLLRYEAPAGTAYRIVGSEDLIEWRHLGTTVMRGWTDSTPVWFRFTAPCRFFDFQEDADFAFSDWDEFEDYELDLAVQPLRIDQGTFRVRIYTNLSPMPKDGSGGYPWGDVAGSIEESVGPDGAFRISTQPAWEVQMAGIAWFQIRIELESEDGQRAEIAVTKLLSDRSKHLWPNAPHIGSRLGINQGPSNWADGVPLMVIEEEEIPVAE